MHLGNIAFINSVLFSLCYFITTISYTANWDGARLLSPPPFDDASTDPASIRSTSAAPAAATSTPNAARPLLLLQLRSRSRSMICSSSSSHQLIVVFLATPPFVPSVKDAAPQERSRVGG